MEWPAAGRDKSDPDADQSCQGLTNYLLSLVFKCVNDSVLVRVCRYVIATGSIGWTDVIGCKKWGNWRGSAGRRRKWGPPSSSCDSIAPATKTSTCQSLSSHDHQSEASTKRKRKGGKKEKKMNWKKLVGRRRHLLQQQTAKWRCVSHVLDGSINKKERQGLADPLVFPILFV